MNKMTHTKFNLNNFLLALSQPLDNAVQNNHFGTTYSSQRVGYIALNIATFNDFTPINLSDMLSLSLLHKHNIAMKNLADFPFNDISLLDNAILKQIILLSNEVESNLNIQNGNIINKDEIIEVIENLVLDETIKENFFFLSEKESFWFDLINTYRLPFFILDMLCDTTLEISYESLIRIAKNISKIVYEYCEWSDVNLIEESLNKLCKLYNFDAKDTSRMILSGYLSNIGLLKIPQHILQKPQQLTSLEYEIIKSAPYHTKQILSMVFGFDDIATLSSSIYEKLDGSGYPYKLEGNELGLKNRILSVALIGKALGENRNYRKGFLASAILSELENMSEHGYLDLSVVSDFKLTYQQC